MDTEWREGLCQAGKITGGWRVDGGPLGSRRETGFRQARSLLERASTYLLRELAFYRVKKGHCEGARAVDTHIKPRWGRINRA